MGDFIMNGLIMEANNMDKDFNEYKKTGKKPRDDYDRSSRDEKRKAIENAIVLTNQMTMLTVGLTVGLII